MLLEDTNLILTGWVSSGSTSTALILAKLLKKKFVYAGGMYKRLAAEMGYDPKSSDLIKFEETYGERWDWLWENYLLWKLANETNILANAKIVGFIIDSTPNVFSSFITVPVEVRAKRASGDSRSEQISERDKVLQARWKKVFGIDFMDIDFIRQTHDLVIDNSNISIAQTAYEIFNSYKLAMGFSDIYTLKDFEREEKTIIKIGSKEYQNTLEKENLVITHKEIASDWITKFQKQLKETSPEWQEAVKKILN